MSRMLKYEPKQTHNFVLNWSADEDSAQVWKSIWTMDALKSLHDHKIIQMGECRNES